MTSLIGQRDTERALRYVRRRQSVRHLRQQLLSARPRLGLTAELRRFYHWLFDAREAHP